MTVITPALFAVRGQEGYGPRLAATFLAPVELEQLTSWALDERVAQYLQPVRFEEALQEPVIGVPLIASHRLRQLLDGVDRAPPDRLPTGRWWDFIRTVSGDFALFPGDEDWRFRLVATALLPSGSAVQLRRLYTGLEYGEAGMEGISERPALALDPCVHEVDGFEPGAPYAGRCVNQSCPEGCSPLIYVNPDDGVYRLLGCDCSES